MAKFNGHKNWNHWNVSLWINNDEGLYRLAKQSIRSTYSRQAAAREMCDVLAKCNDTPTTPDGAPYSVSSIRAACNPLAIRDCKLRFASDFLENCHVDHSH